MKAGDLLNDLHQFDLDINFWTDISLATVGQTPSRRAAHGFTSTSDGQLYVFGGGDSEGY